VGVLADNVPEFSFLLGGCAFAGAVLVALNPTRRGEVLASDVARTDADRWHAADPVWWRPYGRGHPLQYVTLDAEQATSLTDPGIRP
jgi:fatty-acyl-CoA synthase